jgi:uncharacterized membrane-anchored protein
VTLGAMAIDAQRDAAPKAAARRQMLNKVPEVTIYFWIIKVLATTVGETAADYLNTNLNMGLTGTSWVMSGLLIFVLFFQFRSVRYVPSIYWLAVVLISVVGTLVSDNLTDNFGVSLTTTTIVFGIALAATFIAWYASERTLSIHTIHTVRREAFYWATILFTFALGTSALLFGGLITAIAVAHLGFRLNAVLAFWAAYVLTRPLGASLGDYLSQAKGDGGLGLGTTATSVLFLATILTLVSYLTFTRRDATAVEA